MSEDFPILSLKNVQLFLSSNLESGKQISMMHYRGKTFRPLNVFFNTSCKKNAQLFCQNFAIAYGNKCLLLQKNNEYGVWLEIEQQQSIETTSQESLNDTTQTEALESKFPNAQICFLLIQVITDDVEYLMGNRQKKAFQEEIIELLEEFISPDSNNIDLIDRSLVANPLTAEELPDWTDEEIDRLFFKLGNLGIKYFGNLSFVDRALEALKEFPVYQNSQFFKLSMKFIFICKNIKL
jgi:hypothetical protein